MALKSIHGIWYSVDDDPLMPVRIYSPVFYPALLSPRSSVNVDGLTKPDTPLRPFLGHFQRVKAKKHTEVATDATNALKRKETALPSI